MLSRLLTELFRFRKGEPAGRAELPGSTAGENYRSSPETWIARGRALEAAGDVIGALDCFRACAAAYPAHLNARLAVADALSTLWRVEECLVEFTEALRLARDNRQVFSGYLLWAHLAARPDPRALYELHRQYGEMLSATVPPRYRGRYAGTPDPARPLRV